MDKEELSFLNNKQYSGDAGTFTQVSVHSTYTILSQGGHVFQNLQIL
jgi:hypothetical protein